MKTIIVIVPFIGSILLNIGCAPISISKKPNILKNKRGAETSAWLKEHGYQLIYIDKGYALMKNEKRLVFINPDIEKRFDNRKSNIYDGVPLISVSVDNITIDIYDDYLLLYVKGIGKVAFDRTHGYLTGIIWLSW